MSGGKSIHVPQEWETLVRGKGGACYNRGGAADPEPNDGQASQEDGGLSARKRKREHAGASGGSDGGAGDDRSFDSDMGVKSTQDVCRSILQVLNRTVRCDFGPPPHMVAPPRAACN